MNSQNSTPVQLFSIDVDAHLKKAASHTFGSPAHYPVELVRACLRRGAQRVDIRFARNSIQVQDNGTGLDEATMEILTRLMNPDTATAAKEAAVEALQTREGLGLLAIFASAPTEILVENNAAHTGKMHTLHFCPNQFKRSTANAVSQGTSITLHGKHGDFAREKELLEIFCRSVPSVREIRLNNRLIGGQPVLSGQLAIIDMKAALFCGEGQLGIPRAGSLCRLRLLDQGIPWHHLSIPMQRGFVFEAALEYTGETGKITVALLNHLLVYAERLYEWLCHSYKDAPDHLKARIEELIFSHCRQTSSLVLLNQFMPFHFYNSPHSAGYEQLKQIAGSGKLYAVPQKKERLLYNTGTGHAGRVLVLTREQADVLINHLNLPVTFLAPVRHPFFRLRHVVTRIKKTWQKMVLFFFPIPAKIVTGKDLSSEEAFFLRTLNHYLTEHGAQLHPQAGQVKAALVVSRFPFPAVPIKVASDPTDAGTPDGVLYLVRRHHRLVRAAVVAVCQDRENIELFVPLLHNI